MWIAIAAVPLVAAIVGLLWREARLAKTRRGWTAQRSAFDEREAASSLRIVSGNVESSQRQPPLAHIDGTHNGRRDAK